MALKWCLHRRENITRCRCRQGWRFEKMGGFLLKSHRSAKSLDPNRMCEWTLSEDLIYANKVSLSKRFSLRSHLQMSWDLFRILLRNLPMGPISWSVCFVQSVQINCNVMFQPGNTITIPLTSCFTGLDKSILQTKTKIISCHTADSKPVKQEANGTVILPPLVFPIPAYWAHS